MRAIKFGSLIIITQVVPRDLTFKGDFFSTNRHECPGCHQEVQLRTDNIKPPTLYSCPECGALHSPSVLPITRFIDLTNVESVQVGLGACPTHN